MTANICFINTLVNSFKEPQILFLFQLLLIISVAKLTGFILSKIGQPAVVGEIAAGILLGPSILGAVFPEFSANIFPPESLKGLQYLSQIGLILFMFIVGLELHLSELKVEIRSIDRISLLYLMILYFSINLV